MPAGEHVWPAALARSAHHRAAVTSSGRGAAPAGLPIHGRPQHRGCCSPHAAHQEWNETHGGVGLSAEVVPTSGGVRRPQVCIAAGHWLGRSSHDHPSSSRRSVPRRPAPRHASTSVPRQPRGKRRWGEGAAARALAGAPRRVWSKVVTSELARQTKLSLETVFSSPAAAAATEHDQPGAPVLLAAGDPVRFAPCGTGDVSGVLDMAPVCVRAGVCVAGLAHRAGWR